MGSEYHDLHASTGPKSLSGQFAMDGQPIPNARVERWPQVGATSLFFFDDPTDAARYKHCRQSSRIVSIARVAATCR
ncbi:hypothetical protein SAMN04488581_4371 [Mycolicibacterium neoaurum]|uniref:hypothetical protein n=1 Tax=Mycolicibacterium neoaurum TaxID=1795 RepID=UPI00056306BD|nr:hypothetical protein [Mycolicibacterium neoaurum]SDE61985.1 hypothetical protein SAMN04488581_4371 [Mycolicibacterium neoaurum]